VPVPFDGLAAHLYARDKGFEGSHRHGPGGHSFAATPENLVEFGRIDAVQPYALSVDHHRIAVNDPGRTGESIDLRAIEDADYETTKHADIIHRLD